MNKIEVLKQHNPQLGLSFIEVVKQLYPKNKYIELIINLTKHHYKSNKDADKERRDLIDYMYKRHAIPLEELESINNCDLRYINQMLDFIPYRIRETLPKFIEYNERGLIENKDLTSYNSTDDMLRQISIAELKSINKELAKQIHKVYEDEEWLVLRPLSREASLKYGAGTKWCTASTEDDWPYYRYTRRGILVYTINKKTGQKIATFKDIREDHELSFWNEIDTRIDSYEAELPKFIMEIIFNELKSTLTNEDMSPEECKYKDELKLTEPMPEPIAYEATRRVIDNPVNEARIALEQEIINYQIQNEQYQIPQQ
jgi:hypothetical protein